MKNINFTLKEEDVAYAVIRSAHQGIMRSVANMRQEKLSRPTAWVKQLTSLFM